MSYYTIDLIQIRNTTMYDNIDCPGPGANNESQSGF